MDSCQFLSYDLTEAVAAVKNDAPNNKALQNCRLPSNIGGEVDCLLGIKYRYIHPVPIHTLGESGLCIYSSKLKAHDGITNAVIGGTHESFDFFSGKAGGVNQLLTHFMEGLAAFRAGSRPKISINPSFIKEEQKAIKNNLAFGTFKDTVDLSGAIEEEFQLEEDVEIVDEFGAEVIPTASSRQLEAPGIAL